MAWFRCLIRGDHFPGTLLGKDEPIGFYVTRYVEAVDPDSAELNALAALRQEPKLAPGDRFVPTGRERVFFEEIELVGADDVPDVAPGFIWYSMDADEPPAD